MATATPLAPVSLSSPGSVIPFPKAAQHRFNYHVREAHVPTLEAFSPVAVRRVPLRPRTIQFGVIAHPHLRVIKPIPVHVSRKAGSVVAHAKELEEFGCGPSMSAALDDLSKGLAQLYFQLKHDADRLGPDLVQIRHKLTEYIQERAR